MYIYKFNLKIFIGELFVLFRPSHIVDFLIRHIQRVVNLLLEFQKAKYQNY